MRRASIIVARDAVRSLTVPGQRSHSRRPRLPAVLLPALLGGLLLAACSKPSDSGSTAPVADSEATVGANPSTPAPSSAPSQLCIDRGKAAGRFANERDQGTGLDKVVIEIDQDQISADEKAARKDVARQIYHDPFASKLSPDNAAANFQGACSTDVKKQTSDMQNITAAPDIEKALVLFKTYSGQSLTDLLASNGISIQGVQVTQSDGSGNYRAGDVVYTLTLAPTAHADAPCHLQKWVTGDITPQPEFVRRGPAFPLIRPQEDDPLIYWAATGNCSTAFNNN